jgi:hypothetical protein
MAYVAAWALDPAGRETPVIIEAPVAATLKMEEHEALENGEAWLGAVIELQRAGRGVRRPLVGKVVGRRSNDPEPVELEAVTDVLCAVWRLPRLTAFGSRELWLDAVRLRLQEPGHYGEDVPMEAPARRAAR